MCSVIRSFIGTLILVQDKTPVVVFVDRYRLLIYSIVDFQIGIALLYLFYSQGITEARKVNYRKSRALSEITKYVKLSELVGEHCKSTIREPVPRAYTNTSLQVLQREDSNIITEESDNIQSYMNLNSNLQDYLYNEFVNRI